jgi:hypothetical protein
MITLSYSAPQNLLTGVYKTVPFSPHNFNLFHIILTCRNKKDNLSIYMLFCILYMLQINVTIKSRFKSIVSKSMYEVVTNFSLLP